MQGAQSPYVKTQVCGSPCQTREACPFPDTPYRPHTTDTGPDRQCGSEALYGVSPWGETWGLRSSTGSSPPPRSFLANRPPPDVRRRTESRRAPGAPTPESASVLRECRLRILPPVVLAEDRPQAIHNTEPSSFRLGGRVKHICEICHWRPVSWGRGNLRDRVAPNPDREGDRGSTEGVPSWGTGLPRRFPMGPRCPFSSRDSEKRELVPRSTNRRSCVRRAWPGRNRIGPRGSCPLFCAEQRKGRGLFSFAENRRFLVQEQGGLSLPLPLPGNLCIIYPNVVAARSSCPELFSGEPAYVPPLPTPYPRFSSFFERERERVRLHIL